VNGCASFARALRQPASWLRSCDLDEPQLSEDED
jgi:hypothetical protein